MQRISKLATVVATAVVMGALFAGSASAATTLGSTCTGVLDAGGVFFTPSVATATTKGVITSWGVNYTDVDPEGVPVGLDVLQPTGLTDEWVVISTTGIQGATSTHFQTPARIPIAAGQTIALDGAIPFCSTPGVSSIVGLSDWGELVPGDKFDSNSVADATIPLWANIEPDADGDGFGDETQDKCPQSALASGPCVSIKPVATQLPAKNAFKLLLAADLPSTVSATGSVTLPRTKKSKAKTLTFTSKPQTIVPGVLSTLKLSYPAKLKAALAKLKPSKSLKLSIAVNVDGPLAGTFDTAVLNFTQKLKGTAKK